ncbi:MAG: aminodeoxychorismate lyase, partial [Gammaproteobacteria bacterium HGW-Gammaproteobacteria-8]
MNGVAEAMLHPDDRGLLYGDGLFETIAFHHARSRLWPLHMARLAHGCTELGLVMPDPALLAEEAASLLVEQSSAVVRITLTRGSGGRGYFPPAEPAPVTRLLQRRAFPSGLARLRQTGLRLCTSRIELAATPPFSIKHLSRLAQVQIARDLIGQGGDEALVLDAQGRLVEALHGNLVLVRDGQLIEPEPHPAAVAGIGLAWLRQQAGSRMQRQALRRDQLRPGDSIWVINSVRGPIAGCSLDRQ